MLLLLTNQLCQVVQRLVEWMVNRLVGLISLAGDSVTFSEKILDLSDKVTTAFTSLLIGVGYTLAVPMCMY